MSPVHVIVGEDVRAEAMWMGAFGGAIDLYRFPTNVDAFGRLTTAEAPIDLVILTPAQGGPFNLSADQFLARIFEGPLATSAALANLHVIVVGQSIARTHPRVAAVRTLEAAVRLVKFGEVEPPRAMPTAAAPPIRPIGPATGLAGSSMRASVPASGSLLDGRAFSSSVISSIWDAGDRQAEAAADAPVSVDAMPAVGAEPRETVAGGGHAPAATALPQGPAQLFTRATSAGFQLAQQAPTAPVAVSEPAALPLPGVQVGGYLPVMGGGMPAQVGAPGESIQVATGQLLPSRQFQLPEGAGYRGPATRGGVPQAAAHGSMSVAQPVPPALASQVQAMVYGGTASADPLLTWSGNQQGAIVATGVPVPGMAVPAMPAQPMANAQPAPMPAAVVAPQLPLMVPMQPPAGVYGSPAGMPAVPAPVAPLAAPAFTQSPALAHDPFLARAEAGGGDVSFG
jgi:hypothetical protein